MRPGVDLRWILRYLFVVGLSLTCVCRRTSGVPADEHYRECQGTNHGLIKESMAPEERYDRYRDLYENCTEVLSNLELVYLEPPNGTDFDMSFLENIREVHGYVLIVSNFVSRIPLTNLRIIRGLELYRPQDPPAPGTDGYMYSLFVSGNSWMRTQYGDLGLTGLIMPELREILKGHVLFKKNSRLCYDGEKTINWTYILPDEFMPPIYVNDSQKDPSCSSVRCNPKCEASHLNRGLCWGPEADHCQKITSLRCDEECKGACFGRANSQCCHPECAGGCSGLGKTKCWACRHVNSSGTCEPHCPPYTTYDQQNYQWKINPDFKYSYGTKCLDSCPDHTYAVNGACVSSCGPNKKPVNGTCVACDGQCVARVCNGTTGKTSKVDGFVNSKNIDSFINCTVIEGGLDFLSHTFKGDEFVEVDPLSVDELEVFKDVQEITGYLKVVGEKDADIGPMSLSFLRNLQKIKGQKLTRSTLSLCIVDTNIEYLGLVSLKSIENGNVLISGNPRLCHFDAISSVRLSSSAQVHDSGNADTCDPCSYRCANDTNTCWGPGDDHCLRCKEYRVRGSGLCVESCNEVPNSYADSDSGVDECLPCDDQCRGGCYGKGPDRCHACANAMDGPYCVADCPPSKYRDNSGNCQPCHANCDGDFACTGPREVLGYGGCRKCAGMVFDGESGIGGAVCMNRSIEDCDNGLYSHGKKTVSVWKSLNEDEVLKLTSSPCRRCNDQCVTCYDSGAKCDKCKFYRQAWDDHCVTNCSLAHTNKANYVTEPADIRSPTEMGMCRPCHTECRECDGAHHYNCTRCDNRLVYVSDVEQYGGEQWAESNNYRLGDYREFICVPECPEFLPVARLVNVDRSEQQQHVCSPRDLLMSPAFIGGVTTAVTVIVVSLAIVLGIFLRRQLARSEERKLKLTATMSGLAVDPKELMELTPSKALPDMSSLRLCKESELRRGEIIGSGAFGTVFKGIFLPELEHIKIPVAIKELSESSKPGSSTELLEEARIMATVVHPCCIRIMAVCMTRQMMLVTPLMPFGSMLDYLRRNRKNVGSRVMLTWAKQIAEGMNYLESVGIVHRDLAARNVLVHSAYQVKITDFGLAKMLDVSEETYQATGGKLPLKWLALESIQQRIFTHKTDVWSYGVTLWEIFTYGDRPFDKIRVIDLTRELEKGSRLPQPAICTIDVYMVMIRCWLIAAEDRPTFAELYSEFSRMGHDPGRYLVIQDDALRRLPSGVPDTRDMIRGMSVTSDGSDTQFVSAEEYYLQPRENAYTSHPRHLSAVDEINETAASVAPSSPEDTVDGLLHSGPATRTSPTGTGNEDDWLESPVAASDYEGVGAPKKVPPPLVCRTDKDGYLAMGAGTEHSGENTQAPYLDLVESPSIKTKDLAQPDYLTLATPPINDYYNKVNEDLKTAVDNPQYYEH